MDRRLTMGLAAVAALGLLLYLRKSAAAAEAAGTGGVLTSNAALLNAAMGNAEAGWGATPVTIIAAAAPAAVSDAAARSPAPAPTPAPAPLEPTFGIGEISRTWLPYEGSTFEHMTEEQRKGRTDGQLALAIMGY